MFRNINEFFEEVYNGNVSEIDISNFIYIVTDEEPYRLLLIKKDLKVFIFKKDLEMIKKIGKISIEDKTNKLNEYYTKGEEPPTKIWVNHIGKKLNKRNGNNIFIEEEIMLDYEKMFFPHELFCINKLYELDNYIDSLINKQENQTITNNKHENIFSNNGFVLFEHILKEYVKTKRGRLRDIHFFYWSMYNNNPQYIHQRPERFKEWFFNTYKEDLGQIKTYTNTNNPDRLKHYSNALDWFKTQK